MTLSVDMSVGVIVLPVFVLNFAIVSCIHFWMPTASCWPHHHIFRVAGPPPLELELLPPHAARSGPRLAAARPPAPYWRSCRRESGRSKCSIQTSGGSQVCQSGQTTSRCPDPKTLVAALSNLLDLAVRLTRGARGKYGR